MQKGDIILCNKGSSITSYFIWIGNIWSYFSFADFTKCTHVALAIDEKKIIEADTYKGVVVSDFYYKNNYKIVRKRDLSEQQKNILIETAKQQLGKKYSFWLILVLFFLKIFHIEWIMNGVGYEGEICSVLVSKSYAAIKYKFKSDESIDVIDPGDIAKCVLENDQSHWDIIEDK